MPNEGEDIQKDDAADDTESGEGEGEDKGEEVLDDKDYQPEVRKTPWSNREERAEFFKKKKGEKGEGEGEGEGEEGEKEPDVRSVVQEELNKAIKPLTEVAKSQALDSEINAFLAANPQFKKFEKLARKDAVAYPTTPISKIFRSLAYDESGETAKNIEKKKEEAKNKKLGGSPQRRGITAPIKPSLISDEKLREVRLRVKMGEKINPLELE